MFVFGLVVVAVIVEKFNWIFIAVVAVVIVVFACVYSVNFEFYCFAMVLLSFWVMLYA